MNPPPRCDAALVSALLAGLGPRPGVLLPLLHAVQERLGCVPPDGVPVIAAALNLSRAEVHGVISFYHDFRSTPPGRHRVRVCRAEACQAVGGDALAAHAARRLGLGFGEDRADGAVTLEAVYCLGNCACAPSVMIDGELHGRVSAARFDALTAGLSAAAAGAGAGA